MLPSKVDGKTIFKCRCGHSEGGDARVTETIKHHHERKFDVVENEVDIRPIVKIECPKCGNMEAHNWELQTRSGDEAATQFFKCTKCHHTWREYK